ncbi:MAG: glycosyl hydrolase [Cyclobacteriaceae bacterium]|nr:glycosyl hydrolase [Cyclobacteriaceae bacterium]
MKALIATAKGLLTFDIAPNIEPEMEEVHFIGLAVNMVYVDERTNRWWAGVAHKHWGQKLHFSDDNGKTWHETAVPSFRGLVMPDGKKAKLRQIWCMQHGGVDKPDHLWLGTDPGGLFHSIDNGHSFQLVKGLWDHPSRMKEGQWFGAGSDYPFIHSIVVDSSDSNHVYVAISCAGVFETKDYGKTWAPKNKGLKATYLPTSNVEVGHDPHQLLHFKKNPKILWQQNHCGVFYSSNGGDQWEDVSVDQGYPNYGFSIAIDEEDPAKAWVIPVESDEKRIAPELSLSVFQTNNFGKTWKSVSEGLPRGFTFEIVLRQAFTKKNNIFLFGTTNGNLYYSLGEDILWKNISSHLAKVNAVYLH